MKNDKKRKVQLKKGELSVILEDSEIFPSDYFSEMEENGENGFFSLSFT